MCTTTTLSTRDEPGTALVDHWLPALGRPVDRLSYGGKVADVGCGRGAASVLIAKRFPLVSVHGFDLHGPSVETARAAAQAAGVGARCTFTEASADDVPAGSYDVLLLLDCLHDAPDPLAVARRAGKVVASDGVVMVVGPMTGAEASLATTTDVLLDAGFPRVVTVDTTPCNYVVAAYPAA